MPKLGPSASTLAAMTLGLVTCWGCSSDSTTVAGVTHPTLIEVSPEEFLGELSCSTEASGVRRYVATLFDVTDGADGAGGAAGVDEAELFDDENFPICGGFQLPSSRPTSCLAAVGFGFVVSGRRYCVEVDGYDTDDIEPRAIGTRRMVVGDPDDAEPGGATAPLATRSWRSKCDGAVAAASHIVRARGCLPFAPQPTPGAPASLRVDAQALLGDLTCGSEPGQVDLLDVRAEYRVRQLNEATGETEVVVHNRFWQDDCALDPLFEDLPGRVSVSLVATLFSGLDTVAGATCQALTVPGTSVVAQCNRPSAVGTLRVDLESALAYLDLSCDATISDVQVQVPGEEFPRSFPPPDCLEPFDHGFPAGDAGVMVTVVREGEPPAELTCHGIIKPGSVVVAECGPASP